MKYSYSRLNTYKKCPAKFKYTYVDKIPVIRITSERANRGLEIHQSVEEFINGSSDRLHDDIHEHYGQYFLSLRELHEGDLFPEYAWGLTKGWEPCNYDDPNAMLRGYIDLLIKPVDIQEYKTGKMYPDHAFQSMIYGIVGLVTSGEPEVTVTRTYFDLKKNERDVYKAVLLDYYKEEVQKVIDEIEAEDIYPAMPSYLCQFCEFSKNPCKF